MPLRAPVKEFPQIEGEWIIPQMESAIGRWWWNGENERLKELGQWRAILGCVFPVFLHVPLSGSCLP